MNEFLLIALNCMKFMWPLFLVLGVGAFYELKK